MRITLGIFDILKRKSRIERFLGFYEHRINFLKLLIYVFIFLYWLEFIIG